MTKPIDEMTLAEVAAEIHQAAPGTAARRGPAQIVVGHQVRSKAELIEGRYHSW
ncbi:MAG: hypothetical protein KJ621_18935 [Proteobacteria bacterium]|nr:hypothetical protein [Pseudomonadota bacterium]